MLNRAQFRRNLLAWYTRHKRDLPWRRTSDPYCVWLSEIMLQQTRVSAVVPYYERFLARFPSIAALAQAKEQDVLAAWAGLGYYSRARNLQKAARRIQQRGVFPSGYEQIRELPGVGDYTAAAIASIAFGQPHAALDGNVMRLLSRVMTEPGDIGSPATRARLQTVASELLDPRRPGEFNQAMMELGATICIPKQPQCLICPIAQQCQARRAGMQEHFPVKQKRRLSNEIFRELLIIRRNNDILFWQRPPESRRLAGFWELPEPVQLPGARVAKSIGEFRHTIVNTKYCFQVLEGSVSAVPDGFTFLAKKLFDEMPLSTTAKKALVCLESRRLLPERG